MRLQPSELVFLVGFVIYVTIRGVFARRAKPTVKVISRRDAREVILMAALGVATVLLPILYVFTPWLRFADYRLMPWMPWGGAVVMTAALWLFWRSHVDLAENWSITLEVRRGHELITHGVYRSVRHPMYAAIWLFSLAQGLLLHNWLAGWAALLLFAFLYVGRIRREEQMMCDVFGQAYREYMLQTGRLYPRLTSKDRG